MDPSVKQREMRVNCKHQHYVVHRILPIVDSVIIKLICFPFKLHIQKFFFWFKTISYNVKFMWNSLWTMCVILNYVQNLCSEETITIIGETPAACTSRMQPHSTSALRLCLHPHSTTTLILIIPLLNKITVETNLKVNGLNCKEKMVIIITTINSCSIKLIQWKKQSFKGYS